MASFKFRIVVPIINSCDFYLIIDKLKFISYGENMVAYFKIDKPIIILVKNAEHSFNEILFERT